MDEIRGKVKGAAGRCLRSRTTVRFNSRLVVALNADESVRGLKGPTRPLQSESDRARILAALACVDYVTLFTEETPLELIKLLKPDLSTPVSADTSLHAEMV